MSFPQKLADRAVVAVDPTATVIVDPLQVTYTTTLEVELINDDPAQTLNAYVQRSWAQAGPWYTSPYDGLQGIGPGESKMDQISVYGSGWMRVVATASGAGLSARISVRYNTVLPR